MKKTGVVAGGAVAASTMFPNVARAVPSSQTLKVGLVGCGGRGTGAAGQALAADGNIELSAVADVSKGKINGSLRTLTRNHKDKVKVEDGNMFIGLDGFQKVIDSGVDVVILTTPPGFRPQHLAAAIDAGKHVFCEKPVAVDAPGVRSVLDSAKKAKAKNLSLVTGFCWRYNFARRETFQRIHDGEIGDVTGMYSTYYTGPVKPMPEASKRPEGMADVAWQISNWYNFSWLSGDSLVEQAIHSVDKICWAMKDADPIAAVATGGRQIKAHGGNIFDHFHIVYEFANNVKCHMGSRQIPGCFGENADYIQGTKGTCIIGKGPIPMIVGENRWRYGGQNNDMYQEEHNTLFKSIREDKPVNDGEWMAHSTMVGILGRMAAYTGQRVEWEDAINSKEDLAPDDLKWDDKFEPSPMPMPGKTKFV